MRALERNCINILAALLLTCAPFASASADNLVLYDTFKGKRLDPDKWLPWDSNGALEVLREVKGGKAILKTVTYGAPDSDAGRRMGNSFLAFPESIGSGITEIEVTAQTKTIEVTACDNSSDFGRVLSPRIAGYWFNDGRSTPGSGDRTGDVWANLDARRFWNMSFPPPDGPGLSKKVLQVVAYAEVCENANCSITTSLTPSGNSIVLGLVKRGKKSRLRMMWDQENNRFVFQLNKDEIKEIPYTISDDDPPSSYSKRIEHRSQPQNCDISDGTPPEPPVGLGEVRILDVKVDE